MTEKEYDVVIAGGSRAGAAAAILLLREDPQQGMRFFFANEEAASLAELGDARPIVKNLAKWLALELREGWRTWFPPSESAVPVRCGEVGPVAP